MELFRDKADFEYAVQELLRKEFVVEEYCPHCNNHCRLIKVFECSGNHWRCLACLGLIYKASIPIKEIRRWSEAHPSQEELRAYADKVEEQRKKEEEEAKRPE